MSSEQKDLYEPESNHEIASTGILVENSHGSSSENLIPRDKIQKLLSKKLSLRSNDIFKEGMAPTGSLLSRILPKRKKIVYYYVTEKEFSVDVREAKGNTELPLVTKAQVDEQIRSMPKDVQGKITHLHLGCVKMMITATFTEGINTPFRCAFMDRRINDLQAALFGGLQGNLSCKRLMVSVCPKVNIPITTRKSGYIYRTNVGKVTSIGGQLNNVNQITGCNFVMLHRIASRLGVRNEFIAGGDSQVSLPPTLDFSGGGSSSDEIKKIQRKLEDLDRKIERIQTLNDRFDNLVTRIGSLDTKSADLEEIFKRIKSIDERL